jgi:hypothetical protein
VNTWEMGSKLPGGLIATETLYQVKAFLKRVEASVTEILAVFKRELIADIRASSPSKKEPVYRDRIAVLDDPMLLELSLFDLHLNKQAWAEESGDNYDTATAKRRALAGVRRSLRLTQHDGVTQVLFPVGNDFNVDTLAMTTTGGTQQDTHMRALQMFREGVALWREAIDTAAKLYPVHVLIVPGNHDQALSFFLGEVLAAVYENSTRVTVDNGPKLRKRYRWGTSLIGFTHGSEEKPSDLPLLMANEWKQDWAETEHHEWHIGHLHKAKETRFTAGDSFGGVRVRILPSLSGTDAWHYKRGYTGEIKALEAYLWGKRSGYAGHRSINATTLDQAA